MKYSPILFICLLFVSAPSYADVEYASDIPTRFEHSYVDYYINDDGTHVETEEWAYTVLKESALKNGKRYTFSYSTSVEEAEVIEAYTLKPDGKLIEVPKTNYQVNIDRGKGKDGPLFSDRTSMTVVFPDAEVGDTFFFKYKVIQKEPIFPGHISFSGNFYRTTQDNDVRVTVNAPAALWAQYKAYQMKETVTEKEGRKIITWTYQNKKPIKNNRRNWSVFYHEKHPGYSYSTFKNYAQIAQAYGKRALPKAVPTDRVKALAADITKDATTLRDKAKALYEWVVKNITYAGNCVGVGTVVPHDTDIILDNRMGDCKDKATLLQAFLKAVGIESTQALVNARSYYRLPEIPVVTAVNHVISYIPSLKLYLDPTATTTPFGMLPFGDQDKDVLLVENYRQGERTPATTYTDNKQTIDTDITVNSDGSITSAMTVGMNGVFATSARASWRYVTKDIEERMMDAIIKKLGYIGSGSIDKEDAKALLDTYSYKVNLDLKSYLQRPGAGAFNIQPTLPTAMSIQGYLTRALSYDEDNDVSCMGGIISEAYAYRFAKDMSILAKPEDVQLSNQFLTYKASYQLDDHTLRVKRTLEDKTQGNVCTPDNARTYKEFAQKALKNIKSQVVYK